MRVYLVASIALLTASPLLVVACGGSSTSAGGTKSPEPAAATGASASPEPVSSTTTTTTALLSDAGDLQGTKLETKTTTTTSTPTRSDAGAGPHKSEPGRAVTDIQTIIMSRRDEIRACYDRSLKDHPGIEGDIDVKWVIDPKGNVSDASIDEMKTSIAEPGVRACILDIIKKIKFSESAKGLETRAHYPFNFNPKSGGRVQPAGSGK